VRVSCGAGALLLMQRDARLGAAEQRAEQQREQALAKEHEHQVPPREQRHIVYMGGPRRLPFVPMRCAATANALHRWPRIRCLRLESLTIYFIFKIHGHGRHAPATRRNSPRIASGSVGHPAPAAERDEND
jgi:hypothetical protein